jgi:tetratricopeptide (TPR) repeat protein
MLGDEHPKVAISLGNLASSLETQGKLVEAEALHREALAMTRKLLGNEHPQLAGILNNLATLLSRQRRNPEAEPLLREALAITRKLLGDQHPQVAFCLRNLAKALDPQGEYAEAESLCREALRSFCARLDAGHEEVLVTSAYLGQVLSDWAWVERPIKSEIRNPKSEILERAREAESLLRDCLKIRLHGNNVSDWRTSQVKSILGGALLAEIIADATLGDEARQAKFAEAEILMIEGNEVLQQSQSIHWTPRRGGLERLVRLYEAWDEIAPNTGKAEQAQGWKKKLEALDADEQAKVVQTKKAAE